MNNSNQLLRKAKIRMEAKTNMEGKCDIYYKEILDDTTLEEKIYENNGFIKNMSDVSFLQIHGYIVSKKKFGKLIVFVKKVYRKIKEKIFGWYYMPIIEQQNVYNRNNIEVVKNMKAIIETQNKQIKELKEEIDVLKEALTEE